MRLCSANSTSWSSIYVDLTRTGSVGLSGASPIRAPAGMCYRKGWPRWAESVLPARTDWRQTLSAAVRRRAAALAGNVNQP